MDKNAINERFIPELIPLLPYAISIVFRRFGF